MLVKDLHHLKSPPTHQTQSISTDTHGTRKYGGTAGRHCKAFFKQIKTSGFQCTTDKSKKFNFAIRHFQKKINLTIDLLSLGIYAPRPQLLTYRPQVLWRVRICTPFRVPVPERRVRRFRFFRIGRL